MGMRPVQIAVQYKGRRYGGIYSIAGNLMIARVPGVDSRSCNVDGASEAELARQVLEKMLEDADKEGRLAS